MVQREITFTVDETAIPVFVQAFCSTYHYLPTVLVDGIETTNPESPEAFTKSKIRDFALGVVNAYKINKAREEVVVETVGEDVVGI